MQFAFKAGDTVDEGHPQVQLKLLATVLMPSPHTMLKKSDEWRPRGKHKTAHDKWRTPLKNSWKGSYWKQCTKPAGGELKWVLTQAGFRVPPGALHTGSDYVAARTLTASTAGACSSKRRGRR